MACTKCGCRMVTKVGRPAEGRFVCADCGRPVDGLRLAQEQRQRWQGALVVSLLALSGTLVFFLASANEVLKGGDGVETVAPGGENGGGEKGEAGGGGESAGEAGAGETAGGGLGE